VTVFLLAFLLTHKSHESIWWTNREQMILQHKVTIQERLYESVSKSFRTES